MEYESRVLIMSRLAAVHLYELRFGKLGHLKDDSQSCLAQSDLQESVNLKSIKNRIHNMIFCHSAQDSGSVTFWLVGDINFQVFPELHSVDLIGRLTALSQTFSCKLTCLAQWKFFSARIFQSPTNFFLACSLMNVTFILLSSSSFLRSIYK